MHKHLQFLKTFLNPQKASVTDLGKQTDFLTGIATLFLLIGVYRKRVLLLDDWASFSDLSQTVLSNVGPNALPLIAVVALVSQRQPPFDTYSKIWCNIFSITEGIFSSSLALCLAILGTALSSGSESQYAICNLSIFASMAACRGSHYARQKLRQLPGANA